MITATLDQRDTSQRRDHVVRELRDAHLAAADVVARLDFDDAQLWEDVDDRIAELTASAYELTAAITGDPPRTTATNVPPIVRVRELATAQRALFGALRQQEPTMLPIESHMIAQLRMEELHRQAEAERRLAPFRRRRRIRVRVRIPLPARPLALIRRVLRTT